MPFTWVYPTSDPGEYAESEEVQEIRTNMNTLVGDILNQTPVSSETVTFVQPIAEGDKILDEAADEIQLNLDTLKSENYCRGHHNARHISNNASDRQAIHNLECNDLATGGNISDNADYRGSRHSDRYFTNYSDHNITRCGTFHADYDNTKR